MRLELIPSSFFCTPFRRGREKGRGGKGEIHIYLRRKFTLGKFINYSVLWINGFRVPFFFSFFSSAFTEMRSKILIKRFDVLSYVKLTCS